MVVPKRKINFIQFKTQKRYVFVAFVPNFILDFKLFILVDAIYLRFYIEN